MDLEPWRRYTIIPPHELAYLSDQLERLPAGDIIVAGSFRGGDVMMFQSRVPRRNVVVIDSFEGVADPSAEDGRFGHRRGEFSCGGVDAYRANFLAIGQEPPRELYPMWITAEALEAVPHRPVALLWMDLDHYEPTLACLRYFWPDLVAGGQALSHDLGNPRCPGVARAFEDFGRRYTVHATVGRAAAG